MSGDKDSKDLEQLWQQLDQQFDQNDQLEPQQVLASRGLPDVFTDEGIGGALGQLLNQALVEEHDISKQDLGKYKIIRQIDSGGQSDVYLAQRDDGVYQQKVIIKFISARYDFSELKQQFLQEMQLLADLKHPGVVSILDGDITASGQPWLVLDYIEGLHIDQYVKQHQLSHRDVVDLFINLCDVLQFIHQRGVLHKDIKPGNVLINVHNQVPYPVLIDFGIAREQRAVRSGLSFGTQGYSAPEQLAGGVLDQRADLYSLGIMLGQLLLGQQLENPSGRGQLLGQLRQSTVPRDLIQVVKNMTAADPQQRYDQAEAVRNDLHHWLRGLPLSTDQSRVFFVLWKAIKRHRLAALLVAFSVLFGLGFTIKYTRDISELQQLTVAEKNATDELMNFMLDDLFDNLARIGRIDVLQAVADKSVSHLSSQDIQALDAQGIIQSVKAYINAGRVYDQLDKSERAQHMYQQAAERLQLIADDQSVRHQYWQLASQLGVQHSQVLAAAGQQEETQTVLDRAIRAAGELLQIDPAADQRYLWEAHLEYGYLMMEYGNADAARKHIDDAIGISRKQLAEGLEQADWQYRYSHSLQARSWYEMDYGVLQTGISDLELASALAKQSIDQDRTDLKKQNNLRILFNQLAFFYLEDEQLKAAEQVIKQAIELGEELQLKAPFNQEYSREQAYSYSTAGEIYQQLNQPVQALELLTRSMNMSATNLNNDPHNFSAANDLAIDYLLVGGLHLELGQIEQANELFFRAEQLIRPIHEQEPNNKYYLHTLVVALLENSKPDEARPLLVQLQDAGMIDSTIKDTVKRHQLTDWIDG
ncbi:protein kinase [Marinicella sediminis]|uniref:Protein kinase n=2 Tax=Marinicella sediminis TaxID=1792834 RepID=A0ABV7JDW7_9GAMM|nr:serine/threonine-protein kinase [Marinicella sediminis]